MPNVPYSYEVNGKLVTGNGSLKYQFVPYQTVPYCQVLLYYKNPQTNLGK
jgi:hypothetical protein